MQKLILQFLIIGLFGQTIYGQTYELSSPNNRLSLRIDISDEIRLSISKDEEMLLKDVKIDLRLTNLSSNLKVRRTKKDTKEGVINPLYGLEASIPYAYQSLEIQLADRRTLTFRLFENAFSYQWKTAFKEEQTVTDEIIDIPLNGDEPIIGMVSTGFHGYENNYQFSMLDSISADTLALPFSGSKKDQKIIFAESNLKSYPGLHFRKTNDGLTATFPKYVTAQDTSHFDVYVKERADFLAKVEGTRSYPWRIFILPDQDIDLLSDRLVYLHADEPTEDFGWVKPGKVAWDWWNAISLTGVDFEAGVNTESYKYFIDFAAEYGIEYINLDEGWSDQFDLFDLKKDVDPVEIIRYANSKGVGVFLWCVWHTLHRQMPEILDQFQEWGVAGIKVDFMNRDDQEVVDFYHRLATEAAKRKILINYHGAYKPTGLIRTYPNVINREAVMGLEYSKWSDRVSPSHNVTIPFLRALAGPMDYTPGAMRNAVYEDFRSIFSRPMSQGTRIHQLAMFVIFYAPLQMTADAPTDYEMEPKYSEFMTSIPTTWDESIAIAGEIGKYVVLARRKGETWYMAGMTDWEEREIQVDLKFLQGGNHRLEGYEDGPNAHLTATDYRMKNIGEVNNSDQINVLMKSGGGFVYRISK